MTPSDLDIVRELYEAFNAGDIARVRELMHDDIEWVEPAGYFVPEGAGTTRGLDAVLAIFERYPQYWESFAPTPEEFYDAGGGVVFVIGTQHGRTPGGNEVAASFINFWRVEDGRLTVHRSWSDTKTMGETIAKG
jgi:ketosteroid isomerase-like protein